MDREVKMFEPISLSDMDSVKLMNRTDRKYCVKIRSLAEVMRAIREKYYVLDINGMRAMPYSTVYYDTEGDDMFSNHVRGKLNRYKIRKRCYLTTGISFLEVKFKNNKGRTIKVRKKIDDINNSFTEDDKIFITHHSPYSCKDLKSVLCNNFTRVMLVSKDMNERCTIDTSLCFKRGMNEDYINDLAVIEVKSEGRRRSYIIDYLNNKRIKTIGFSKYCMGRSQIDEGVKKNNLKRKLRFLNKLI